MRKVLLLLTAVCWLFIAYTQDSESLYQKELDRFLQHFLLTVQLTHIVSGTGKTMEKHTAAT